MATLTMVFKLALEASKTWKRLKGHQFILHVLDNRKFVDGNVSDSASEIEKNNMVIEIITGPLSLDIQKDIPSTKNSSEIKELIRNELNNNGILQDQGIIEESEGLGRAESYKDFPNKELDYYKFMEEKGLNSTGSSYYDKLLISLGEINMKINVLEKDIEEYLQDIVITEEVVEEMIEEELTEDEDAIEEESSPPEEEAEETPEEEREKRPMTTPTIELEIYEGPTYIEADGVCYYRITAMATGDPVPNVEFSKDDSGGAWGPYKCQINLNSPGDAYTLTATATNPAGEDTASIRLTWGCIESVPEHAEVIMGEIPVILHPSDIGYLVSPSGVNTETLIMGLDSI